MYISSALSFKLRMPRSGQTADDTVDCYWCCTAQCYSSPGE